jgi:hypothetical protein
MPLFTSAAPAPSAPLFASLGFKTAIEYYQNAVDDVLINVRSIPCPETMAGPVGTAGVTNDKASRDHDPSHADDRGRH